MDDALNRNLALEIIDIVIDEKSEESEGFVIDRDEKAEWALRKIAEEKAEAQRYMNVCRSMISEYEEKIRKEEEKLKNKTSFLEGQLQRYFESVSHKVTKSQETYKLPSGTLKLKFQPPEYKRNDELLLKWLKDNQMAEFIKVEEKPNWGEIKKKVIISGEKAITEDGQIVEGVEVVERPPAFEVEV
jgi:phage host-nuclease inhibitor protein Gam